MRWDLVGSSLGDSPKESGSSLGTRREITVRFSEVVGLCGMSGGWTTRATESGRRPITFGGSTAQLAVKPPVPQKTSLRRGLERGLDIARASVEQCEHGTSQRIDSYSSVDFGDRGVELFPSSRGNKHVGTHLKLQLEIVQRPEIFPSTVNPGLPVVIAEAFLSFTHQVQALAGMMQVIIPHIPQLMQSATPQQSAPSRHPSECSPNRPRLKRISPTWRDNNVPQLRRGREPQVSQSHDCKDTFGGMSETNDHFLKTTVDPPGIPCPTQRDPSRNRSMLLSTGLLLEATAPQRTKPTRDPQWRKDRDTTMTPRSLSGQGTRSTQTMTMP
ncbi:hypothetical protein B296_00007205 [Ensete ventricosum]|uniref:Uncharacterized protein n=1 Tax=Ensete ventricosum TaxID=4639 RepID=A0A426ZLD3_ENSVE|nr:hypothetical protein B296_00007205 [Ensete ventricosum]